MPSVGYFFQGFAMWSLLSVCPVIEKPSTMNTACNSAYNPYTRTQVDWCMQSVYGASTILKNATKNRRAKMILVGRTHHYSRQHTIENKTKPCKWKVGIPEPTPQQTKIIQWCMNTSTKNVTKTKQDTLLGMNNFGVRYLKMNMIKPTYTTTKPKYPNTAQTQATHKNNPKRNTGAPSPGRSLVGLGNKDNDPGFLQSDQCGSFF
jgi:hypothetical protein